jgi:putative heme iron utilization protein
MSAGREARLYLRRRHYGVLSTLSRKFAGYPFGSVVPYVLDHAARPVILISRLAEHTKNIDADPRVSLLVSDPSDDVQAGARLTLIGDAVRDGGEIGLARHLNYSPGSERLIALGDFTFYVISPRALRFIGGFGDIHWISAESYSPPPNALAAAEDAIVTHMNAEHAHTLRDCCRFYYQRNADTAVMIGIDCDGFDVRADGAILRFEFDDAVTDAPRARKALIGMAEKARAA